MRRVANADRVAALAYRIGRYDLAQSLASRLDTALAWWVRAKLALRQGDSVQAAQAMPAPPPRSRAPMAASTPTARDACGPNRAC